MKIFAVLILFSQLVFGYSQADWKVYEACKSRVYGNVHNGYDYSACSEMLSHKDALRQYGASSSYNYWMKRLYGR